MPVPEKIVELCERFEFNRDSHRSATYNEAQVRREYIDPFFECLSVRSNRGVTTVLTNYLRAVMHRAKYEILTDDHTFYGEIPGFDGVYANAPTLEACREELEEVLEEWTLFRVSQHLSLPSIDGLELTIRKVA